MQGKVGRDQYAKKKRREKGVEKEKEEKCGREEKKGKKEGFYKDIGNLKMNSSGAYI